MTSLQKFAASISGQAIMSGALYLSLSSGLVNAGPLILDQARLPSLEANEAITGPHDITTMLMRADLSSTLNQVCSFADHLEGERRHSERYKAVLSVFDSLVDDVAELVSSRAEALSPEAKLDILRKIVKNNLALAGAGLEETSLPAPVRCSSIESVTPAGHLKASEGVDIQAEISDLKAESEYLMGEMTAAIKENHYYRAVTAQAALYFEQAISGANQSEPVEITLTEAFKHLKAWQDDYRAEMATTGDVASTAR